MHARLQEVLAGAELPVRPLDNARGVGGGTLGSGCLRQSPSIMIRAQPIFERGWMGCLGLLLLYMLTASACMAESDRDHDSDRARRQIAWMVF
jgi:hypothetical protein